MDPPPPVAGVEPEPCLQLLEEKRCRRRAKNRAKKEDSKRVREEEIRRKLYEPKNRQGVRLVGVGEAETLRGRAPPAPGPPITVGPVTPEDFPDLGCPGKQHRRREGAEPERQGARPLTIDLTACKGAEPERQCARPLTIDLTACVGADPERQGKARRARPLTIDLMSAVKRPPPAPAPKRRSPVRVLGGNQLDSSNPERKKGKTRENPRPQKPSHLKAVILADRKARQASRALEAASLEASRALETAGLERTSLEAASPETASLEAASPETALTNKEEPGSCLDTGGLVSQMGALGLGEPPSSQSVGAGGEEGAVGLDPPPSTETVGALGLDRHPSQPTVGAGGQVGALPPSTPTVGAGGQVGRPPSIHTRKFRDYCDHVQSPELDAAVTALITDIVKFQDRLYFSDPVRAHAKRRFVLGLRETGKYLALRKLKLVVIAPDLETARSQGGIEDTVGRLRDESRAQGVPCAFSVGRATLRRLTNKSCVVKGISCVGVLSYEGSQDNFHAIRALLPGLGEQYRRLVAPPPPPGHAPAPGPAPDVNEQVVATFLGKLAKELE